MSALFGLALLGLAIGRNAQALAANFHKADKAARWLTVALGAGLVAFAIALSAFSGRLPRYTDLWPPPEVSSIQFTAALAGVAVAIFGLLRRVQMGLYAMILFMLLLVVGTDRLLIKLDPALTARGAPMAASQKWPQFSTKDAATLELKRSLAYQLNFYAHAVLPEWKPEDQAPASNVELMREQILDPWKIEKAGCGLARSDLSNAGRTLLFNKSVAMRAILPASVRPSM